MIVFSILLIVGFVLLIYGADLLVKGSSSLAKRLNIPELIIGLTIVAFGTSAPEMVVNIIGSVNQYDDVVLGNIIGSNIFNLLVILGLSGIIFPITVKAGVVWKEIPFSLFAGVILFLLANDIFVLFSAENIIQRYDSAILLVFFILFMVYIFRGMKKEKTNNFTESKTFNKLKTWLFIILGLAGLILGGKMVVDNAVKIAKMLSMSEKLIGLTIISVGTSLPELATSVIASIRKKSDLAIGNVIGSNIFNIFLVLGISSVIHPQKYHISFNLDLGVYLAGTLFLFIAMFSGTKKRLDRWEALVLLVVFVVYMTWLFVGQPKG